MPGKPIWFVTSVMLVLLVTACARLPGAGPASGAAPAVDPEIPRFTRPLEITNTYLPVSRVGQAIFIGKEDGAPARNEVTLLPATETIEFGGQRVEARVVQFVAYSSGKLLEVAYDYLAQADDGSVYYLGEEVDQYQDGKITGHSGSWGAGPNGAPPRVFKPAHPQKGQVFHPENLPGIAFETGTVMNFMEAFTGPDGQAGQGMLVEEKLMEGTTEYKIYAEKLGVVVDRAGGDQTNLVALQATDAKTASIPGPLSILEAQSEDIIDVAPGGDWVQVFDDVVAVKAAWQAYQSQAVKDRAPRPFLDALRAGVETLQTSLAAKDAPGVMQAANDLSAAVMDLYGLYHPAIPVDVGRLDVDERQVMLDAMAGDMTSAANSLAITGAVWARVRPVVLARQGSAVAAQFDQIIRQQQAALDRKDIQGLVAGANQALALVDTLENLF